MPQPAGKRRPGRRPGESQTREAILDAARARFAEHGWDRTTIRAIARDADVDPALVLHFFDSPRTIDVHLRNVVRKLGITSRTELARIDLVQAAGKA